MWVRRRKSKSKFARAVIVSKLTAPPSGRYRGTRFASHVVTCNITDTNQYTTPTWNPQNEVSYKNILHIEIGTARTQNVHLQSAAVFANISFVYANANCAI